MKKYLIIAVIFLLMTILTVMHNKKVNHSNQEIINMSVEEEQFPSLYKFNQ